MTVEERREYARVEARWCVDRCIVLLGPAPISPGPDSVEACPQQEKAKDKAQVAAQKALA